jgi:hypothetical protein
MKPAGCYLGKYNSQIIYEIILSQLQRYVLGGLLGFVVNDNGLVSVDHQIDDFGITTANNNPTSAKTHCEKPMQVHSIFLRHDRNKGKKTNVPGKLVGDNCPFIYAVKRKVEHLYVNTETVRDLCKPMNEILDKFIEKQNDIGVFYDFIIPMPSSHKIAEILANRVTRKLDVPLGKGFLRKSTSQDVFQQVNNDSDIPHDAKVNIIDAIKKSNTQKIPFSLGDVKTHNRLYIKPVSLAQRLTKCERVLLVDDLFATGRTLITAKEILQATNPNLDVDALCLFSPLNGRIRKEKRRRTKGRK